jgi:energy-coupling factor transporter ATP-binding protein EcfA2
LEHQASESPTCHPAPYAIQLKEVGYRYPRTEEWALNGLNLEVPLGSLCVITGPTGCGKTTLLRLIRGFQKEFGGELVGEVRILGQDLTNLEHSSLGLKMGAVFQNPAGQLHQLRVIDEIMSGPMYQGLPWEECQKRARDAIEAISVKNLLDRNPLKLSGGEQQKVGVTACLAMKCEILLLDEPFSYIEEKSAKELLKILVNLRNQGRTIVLVTHNLKQVIEHADHVALLDKGKCLHAGTPEQVLRSQDSRGILMPLLSPKADPVKRGDPQKGTVASGELARRRVLTQDCIETRADRSQAEPTWDNKKILELRQVEYVYPDGAQGLAGVSLEILAGEILGIVGGNGSGKTTLAKASAGLLRPLRGELFISKLNAERLQPWEIARQVGYVAQLPSEMLFADSVLEECAFGAKCLGLADPIQKAQQALQLVGLYGAENFSGPGGGTPSSDR